MRKAIIGNWKMHGTRPGALALAEAAATHVRKVRPECEVVLCPPAVFLYEIHAALASSGVKLGGQDCHAAAEGPFTGDISAAQLKEAGCSHVIVGHSERRAAYGEHNDAVRDKAAQAITQGLIPIICVGEPAEIRQQGQAEAFVGAAARACVPEGVMPVQFLLAYEPVWSIGTGNTPTLDDIIRMHAHLKTLLPGAAVLYGGSVKGSNAAAILGLPEVDGALVGGASLKAEEFCAIVDAA